MTFCLVVRPFVIARPQFGEQIGAPGFAAVLDDHESRPQTDRLALEERQQDAILGTSDADPQRVDARHTALGQSLCQRLAFNLGVDRACGFAERIGQNLDRQACVRLDVEAQPAEIFALRLDRHDAGIGARTGRDEERKQSDIGADVDKHEGLPGDAGLGDPRGKRGPFASFVELRREQRAHLAAVATRMQAQPQTPALDVDAAILGQTLHDDTAQ